MSFVLQVCHDGADVKEYIINPGLETVFLQSRASHSKHSIMNTERHKAVISGTVIVLTFLALE